VGDGSPVGAGVAEGPGVGTAVGEIPATEKASVRESAFSPVLLRAVTRTS